MRKVSRKDDELRPLRFTPGYIRQVPGSVLVEQGETRVVCTATIDNRVPHFMKNSGQGWITAEYSMLPGSCGKQRVSRERLKVNNRHGEIQRFVGRALRAICSMKAIGERTITLDADVIQADGSTRCASLNGSVVALVLALRHLVYEQIIPEFPQISFLAAVSLGVRTGGILIDLDYEEDSQVDMDLNVVSNIDERIVEIQGFAEQRAVDFSLFQEMVRLAMAKNLEIIQQQKAALKEAGIFLP